METGPKHDWNYRLVRYFLNNHHLTIMSMVFIVVVGLFGFFRLQLQGFPQINIPIVIVSAVSPGSGPDTVARTVVKPIEDALANINGVLEITSTSRNNFGVVVVRLKENADPNLAVQEARTKIASITLPEGVPTPTISVPDVNGTPYIIALTGSDSLQNLLKQADIITDSIGQVDGISSVYKFSNISENFYIDLDPRSLTPDVLNKLKSLKFAGSVSVSSLNELKNISFLRDSAQMYTALDYGNSIHRTAIRSECGTLEAQGGILFAMRLDPDADLLAVDEKIGEALADAQSKLSGDAKATIVFNQADESRRQIKEIREGAIGGKWEGAGVVGYLGYLLGGMWLLTIAILVFLNWRVALISVITVPLSFLITFIFLWIFNIQLNTIVLFSFVLVLGLIVDPAIVVLESITRHIEMGYKGNEAVMKSVSTIGPGIFEAVLTSAVVFVPFAVVSGTFGQIIKYIPITVIPALLASYFVPMLFLTWFGARFIKPKHHLETPSEENSQETVWPGARWIVAVTRKILSRKSLQWLTIILSFIIPIGVAGGLFASGTIHQVQFSQPDDGQYVTMTVPRKENISNSELLFEGRKVETILNKYSSEIQFYFYGNMEGGDSPDLISLFAFLRPLSERDRKSPAIVKDINGELVAMFGENASARELGAGPPTAAYAISVKIFDNDNQKLLEAQKLIAQELSSYPEIDATKYDGEQTATELRVYARENAPMIYGQLAGILGETKLFILEDKQVILRIAPSLKPTSKTALENIMIATPTGVVPLYQVAEVRDEIVPGAVQHFDGDTYAQVSARLKDAKDMIAVQKKIDDWVIANASAMGLTEKAFEKRGSTDEFVKSFQELGYAILFSIIASYIIFVLFFRSYLQPLIILFAIPLTFIGIFPALAIFAGGQLGFLEVLGIITLIGIVENVGLFLIDYANRLMAQGMDKKEAVSLAAGVRFRAILLTKLTALGGLLPLAIFSPFWRGLAVTVVAGIITSGILSLFTTPVLYSWFTRNKKF